ncbi:response regulator with CheY-like receiver domain and winged-helix DNA-binding domain [Rivularia sp. PCC 7116]|uniref:response regulator transcription factor n=1 Tax=Rivularia sp. PCC 7116 TaxID=373994 RepID=UPI00029EE3BC|nr:response regulator [Rivularia sp. PCC 7116]AFY54980.1 response regulator with CheY-like receiver domain and winged-helix DNA-binding domain [Rivularia sp. PCC 7116]
MNQILIVEDEIRLAAFLQKGLRKKGYITTVVEDGQQAVEMASSKQFNLMLLDLGLPVKDGLTVLQELRNQGKKLPIIIMTARSDEREKTEAIAYGADDYLTKPFPFQDLLSRIEEYLCLVTG